MGHPVEGFGYAFELDWRRSGTQGRLFDHGRWSLTSLKNFKYEYRFDLWDYLEAEIADFNFTLEYLDGFLIFHERVSVANNTK